MGEDISMDSNLINSTDEIIREQFREHLMKKLEVDIKNCQRFVKIVQIFPVIAILGLVTLGAVHYEYDILSTRIEVGFKS